MFLSFPTSGMKVSILESALCGAQSFKVMKNVRGQNEFQEQIKQKQKKIKKDLVQENQTDVFAVACLKYFNMLMSTIDNQV